MLRQILAKIAEYAAVAIIEKLTPPCRIANTLARVREAMEYSRDNVARGFESTGPHYRLKIADSVIHNASPATKSSRLTKRLATVIWRLLGIWPH